MKTSLIPMLAFAALALCPAIRADEAAARKLAPVLQPYLDSHTLAGAVVMVVDKDKVLTLEAAGWMDIAAKKSMRTDSVFWIASQSKCMAAAALMILVDEGKVSLDDPVEKFLPEFKNQMVIAEQDEKHMLLEKPRHPITVREALSHTSGLEFKSPIEQPTLDLYPLELRVRSYAMMPLQFQPGSRKLYSNAGINTAGRIIEVVSGMPFEQYLDERIFKPLGMKDTTFWPNAEQLSRLAKAYKPNAASDGLEECEIVQLKYPLDSRERQPMPGGGLFSTAMDVSIFYRMLANGGQYQGARILSEDAVKQMTSDQTREANAGYGLGLNTNDRFFGHGGAYNSDTMLDRASGLIILFLGQHAGWIKGGKEIIPSVQKTAIAKFAPKS